MKYRSDFVTNSSSSSFIVNYANKEEKDKALNGLRLNFPQYADLIIEDVCKGKITYTKAVEIIKKDLADIACYYALDSGKAKKIMKRKGYKNHYELYNDSDFESLCKEIIEVEEKNIISSLHKRGYFAILGYEDHGELGFLERELPNMLNGIVYTRNEH